MSNEPKYPHHSLNIYAAEKAAADEVSAEAGVDIEFKRPLWFGSGRPEDSAGDMLGVFCKTKEDAAWFKRAFGQRRWEDGRNPGSA
jgi:hypothetical protein